MGISFTHHLSTITSRITFTMKNAVVSSLLVSGAAAFPWVAMQPGVDSSILRLKPRQQVGEGPGGPDTCPFNANHEDARPVTDESLQQREGWQAGQWQGWLPSASPWRHRSPI